MILLSSTVDTKEDATRELDRFGLWANAMQEDWNSAARYASNLYYSVVANGEELPPNCDSQSTFSIDKQQHELRQWAIQAFAHTGDNINTAKKLWKPGKDDPSITNSLLQSYLSNNLFDDAKALWDELRKTKNESSRNQQSYDIMLQCGAKSGDIALMERLLEEKKESPATKDSVLFLQTLLNNEPLSAKDQALVVKAFQDIVDNNDETTTKTLAEPENLLSQVFVVLDLPSDRMTVFDAYHTYHFRNLRSPSWDMTLKPAAKVRVIQILWTKCRSRSFENWLFDDDSWDLLESLMGRDNKSMRSFLQQQSIEFCAIALEIASRKSEQDPSYRLADVIVEERWQELLQMMIPPPTRSNHHHEDVEGELTSYDCRRTVGLVLSILPYLYAHDPDGGSVRRLHLMEKVVTSLRKLVHAHLEETLAQKLVEPTYYSPTCNGSSIVLNISLFLRVIGSVLSQAASLDEENGAEQMDDCKFLASRVVEAAMLVVGRSKEFSLEELWKKEDNTTNGKDDPAALIDGMSKEEKRTKMKEILDEDEDDYLSKDNRAALIDHKPKEDIQAIMKELLQTKLLDDDDDLIEPATAYYRALASASQFWSVKDQQSLLFPNASQSLLPKDDPFTSFRNIVMGNNRTLGESSSKGIDGYLPGSDERDRVDSREDEHSALLPTIFELARQSDQRSGHNEQSRLVGTYGHIVLRETDFLMNMEHVGSFCDCLDIGCSRSISLSTDPGWFRDVWNIKLAKMFIEDLATCRRAKIWTAGSSSSKGGKRTIFEELDKAGFYLPCLTRMYAVAGLFSYLKDEDGISLGGAYLEACRANCHYLVDYLASIYEMTPINKEVSIWT